MTRKQQTLTPGRIHQGDCLELMKKIDDGSIDLVFADPPFNIGYEYDEYDDRQEDEKYLDWCSDWIAEAHRILKPNGTFWLAIGDEYAAELKVAAQRKIGFAMRSWVLWYYTFGVNCVRGFSRSHTHLFHFVKDDKDFTFNSENPTVRVKSARQLVYADRRANPKGRLPDNTWFYRPQDIPSGFLPNHDTWYFARVAGSFKERQGFHGCQMPEQLLGRIIRVSSNPGDIVFDPFSGSGTTLAVAKKLGRQWMGTELSKDYASKITSRLKGIRHGAPLDGPKDPMLSAPKTAQGRKLRQPVNEDTLKGVICAYKAASQGYSADHLLCDPELNLAFVEKCKDSGLSGNASFWNHLLLRIRKSGQLPKAKNHRKRLTLRQMDAYSFASEIAMRFMELDYGLIIDHVLCRPEAAREFDQIASSFASGFSSFEYRWAALAIRKRSSTSKKLASKKEFQLYLKKVLPKPEAIENFCSMKHKQSAGVYIVQNDAEELYIGETVNVRQRVELIMQHEPWDNLKPASIRFLPREGVLHGLQSILVQRSSPLLNTNSLCPVRRKKSTTVSQKDSRR
ncbi:MAG: DNA methyltransferase [Planctomycetota bacterium]